MPEKSTYDELVQKLQTKSDHLVELKAQMAEIENQLRLITNNAKDIIFRYSIPNNKFEFLNQAAYNILGYSPEDFYRNSNLFKDLILEDWKSIYSDNWNDTVKNIKVSSFEYQVVSKSGDIIWIYQNSNTIVDIKGNPIAIEGIMRDITNQKQAELSLKRKNIEYLSLNEEYLETNEELRNSNKELIKKIEELKRSEDQYKVLIDQAADGIFIGDTEGYLINVNNSGCRLTGYTGEELKKFKLTDLFVKNNKSEKSRLIDKVDNGKAYKSEEIILRKDTGKIPIEINIKKLSDGRYHAIFRDVSERKQAEEKLRQNEIRFRSLFENMSNNVAIFEVIGNGDRFIFKNFNSAAEKLENIKREDIIGKEAAIVFPLIDEYKLNDTFKRVWNTGKAEHQPIIVTDDSGDLLSWTENFIYRLPSNEIVVIYDDITERKKAEIDLIKTKERYRIATEETMVAVWERNLETGVGHADPVLFDILGYSSPCVSDSFSLWREYIHPQDLQQIQKLNVDLKDGKIKELNFKFRATHKDGSIRWFLDKGVALRNEKGEAQRLIGTITDITQQQKIEEELILSREKAVEADNLKSTFLANMSHEIRTPMNGILGFSDLLKSEDSTEEERENYIDIIHQSGNQLMNIINDILDISKIEVGQIQINEENTSVNEILKGIFTLFKPEVADKKDIKLLIHKELTDKESVILTDGVRLRQILTNLINNAIKFTKKGFVEFGYLLIHDCENEYSKEGACLQFYVKDTGIGIPKNKREIIFDRFRQSDESHTRKFGGTGLGLAISKGFVELLGGNIWHESAENKGSTFYFTIPYKIGDPKQAQKIKAKYSSQYSWGNYTILIVEDDDISFSYMHKILEKTGVSVIRATKGYDAIEICGNNKKIDLILMDIQLPGINGYEATRRIREFLPDIPIIAQTAHALAEDKNKSMESGCNAFITKPIKRQVLLRILEKYF
ncbi:MAG: PAS domain S-box protein [Bacteroidota bacterium]